MRTDNLLPILLVDVDGVCADFVGSVLQCLDSKLTHEDITRFKFEELLSPDEKIRFENICASPLFWAQLEPIKQMRTYLEKLSAEEIEIVYLTSPWLGCDKWHDTRRHWLLKHEFPQAENLIVTKLKHLVYGDYLIDDKPSNISEWIEFQSDLGGPARGFLLAQPWNQDCADWDNRKDSSQIFEWIYNGRIPS